MSAGRCGLVGIGYAGRAVDELIEQLREVGATALVDVRLNPFSRQPGFSKKRLAASLEEAGVAYVHEPTLGNPKENRAAFARDDAAAWQHLRDRFEHEGADALRRLIDRAQQERVAVMCLERDPAHCHRHLVIDMARELAPDLPLIEVP